MCDAIHRFLDKVGREQKFTLISGDARGADTYADVLCQLFGFTIERYPADWNQYGRRAGPIRNQEMLDSGVDYCLAFHEDIENSRGTADMVRRARAAGVPTEVIDGSSQ